MSNYLFMVLSLNTINNSRLVLGALLNVSECDSDLQKGRDVSRRSSRNSIREYIINNCTCILGYFPKTSNFWCRITDFWIRIHNGYYRPILASFPNVLEA
jgi:hypothetical protein